MNYRKMWFVTATVSSLLLMFWIAIYDLGRQFNGLRDWVWGHFALLPLVPLILLFVSLGAMQPHPGATSQNKNKFWVIIAVTSLVCTIALQVLVVWGLI